MMSLRSAIVRPVFMKSSMKVDNRHGFRLTPKIVSTVKRVISKIRVRISPGLPLKAGAVRITLICNSTVHMANACCKTLQPLN